LEKRDQVIKLQEWNKMLEEREKKKKWAKIEVPKKKN
jgi:hypothetical protein